MAATGGVLRILPIFLLLVSLSKSFAVAGDEASRQTLGFSPDGHYFAFEQYGVQDGSGFPYSEIFIIEVAKDRWVSGTPIRVRLDDETRKVGEARDAVRAKAAPLLRKLAIGEQGQTLANLPRREAIDGGQRVPTSNGAVFNLDEQTMDSAECAQYTDQPVKGFTLMMERLDSTPLTLHQDSMVPSSRSCPLGYHIAEILRHDSEGGTSYAVILHMSKLGFEGPDGRFIAVTHRLP